jgi:hypothetical protein
MPFIDASEMLHGAPLQGWSGRFFHSENMTFVRGQSIFAEQTYVW